MSDYIPQEIWVEILLRQTVESLVKCTSVCKEWKSLITDHTFISDHFSRTIQAGNGNGSLLLELKVKYFNNSSFFRDKEFYSYNEQIDHLEKLRIPQSHLFLFKRSCLVGSCNGLVCLADEDSIPDSDNIIIWNPSIRKYLLLPKPSITFSSQSYRARFGLGFDSRTKDFKLVRLLTVYERQGPPPVEIYSLATGSWRSITYEAPSVLHRWHLFWVSWAKPMFINEKLHWIVSPRSRGQIQKFILTFDVVEETFGELMLPEHLEEFVHILSGGNSLAVWETRIITSGQGSSRSFSIWVMKEYGVVESWTEVLRLESRNIIRILSLRRSGEVVLHVCGGAIILLDPMKELVKDVGITDVFDAWAEYHVESLFLLNKDDDVLSY